MLPFFAFSFRSSEGRGGGKKAAAGSHERPILP